MDTYHLKPEHMRAPDNLSKEEIRKSLDELDSKIKILKGRVNATTAESNHTYHEHIAALEAKRSLIASKFEEESNKENSTWEGVKKHIEELAIYLKNLMR